ncbi:MAG TPA: hypothetical protein EYP85_12480 [Armatimonadetes bacterium]|nr:hypothetical protein [Armatimonadota bacterium]
MAEAAIRAEEIEGLREMLAEVVEQQLSRHPLLQDLEALERSPVGFALRLKPTMEAHAQALAEIREQMATKSEWGRLEEKVANIEEQMATKAELGRLEERIAGLSTRLEGLETWVATKEELAQLAGQLRELEARMATKEVETRLATVEARMATKEDLTNLATKEDLERFATKEELNRVREELKGLIEVRTEELGKRLTFFQTVTYGFFSVLFVMIATVLWKLLVG